MTRAGLQSSIHSALSLSLSLPSSLLITDFTEVEALRPLPPFLPQAEKMAVQNLKIAFALRHQTNFYVKLLDVPDILFIKKVVIQADPLSKDSQSNMS